MKARLLRLTVCKCADGWGCLRVRGPGVQVEEVLAMVPGRCHRGADKWQGDAFGSAWCRFKILQSRTLYKTMPLEAGEAAKLGKCFPLLVQGLEFHPPLPPIKARLGGSCLPSPCWGSGHGWRVRVYWPATLPYWEAR